MGSRLSGLRRRRPFATLEGCGDSVCVSDTLIHKEISHWPCGPSRVEPCCRGMAHGQYKRWFAYFVDSAFEDEFGLTVSNRVAIDGIGSQQVVPTCNRCLWCVLVLKFEGTLCRVHGCYENAQVWDNSCPSYRVCERHNKQYAMELLLYYVKAKRSIYTIDGGVTVPKLVRAILKTKWIPAFVFKNILIMECVTSDEGISLQATLALESCYIIA
jgi:hypothetical protein